MNVQLSGLYLGQLRVLEPEGQSTGIYKTPTRERVHVTLLGLHGDVQADRRVHGGPDKALHQYAQTGYSQLAVAFPRLAAELIPGALGENLSAPGMDETNVHVGDIYQIGPIQVQVSEPRSPCWKINHKFGVEKLSRHIDDHGLTGWYYRVLSEGNIGIGDPMTLLRRPNPEWPLERFWQVHRNHRPDMDELAQAAELEGLSLPWQKKLRERLVWLKANSKF